MEGEVSKWGLLICLRWNKVKIEGTHQRIVPAEGEPQYFLPVFDTKEQALQWDNGRYPPADLFEMVIKTGNLAAPVDWPKVNDEED